MNLVNKIEAINIKHQLNLMLMNKTPLELKQNKSHYSKLRNRLKQIGGTIY